MSPLASTSRFDQQGPTEGVGNVSAPIAFFLNVAGAGDGQPP
jgi:hypothetical protein